MPQEKSSTLKSRSHSKPKAKTGVKKRGDRKVSVATKFKPDRTLKSSQKSLFDLSRSSPVQSEHMSATEKPSPAPVKSSQDMKSLYESNKHHIILRPEERLILGLDEPKSSSDSVSQNVKNLSKNEVSNSEGSPDSQQPEIRVRPIIPVRTTYEKKLKKQNGPIFSEL